MSKRKTWILSVVLIIFFAGAAIISLGLYFALRGSVPKVENDSVVEIVISDQIREFPPNNPFLQILSPQGTSLWQLRKIFRRAAEDERIKAVLLEIHPMAWSWAQIEELRDQIAVFRESGKPVHALLAVDLVREQELYLASATDSVTLNPDAGFLVNGLLVEQTFFKGTMEKLGIRPEFIQFKEYKSAESYSRDSLSPAVREMLETIVVDLEERFVASVSEDRNLEESVLEEFMKLGVASAEQGLELGLVDQTGYRHQVEELLAGDGEDSKYRSISGAKFLKAARNGSSAPAEHRAAVLAGVGSIVAGKGDPMMEVLGGVSLARQLRKLRQNDRIEGVILRVNSPGGSAVGSDMVWEEVRKLEQEGKPVVVSMSGVAGSGGYYISMGAGHLVSQPSTITGSIGVIFGKFDLSNLYRWMGISVDQVKSYPHADIFSLSRPLGAEQRKRVEAWIADLYRKFVTKAADSRRMEFQDLEEKARGRIYTGAQAKALGLVDSLGGFDVAIRELKRALSLDEDTPLDLHLYPEPKTWWEAAFSGDLVSVIRSFTTASPLNRWTGNMIRHLESPGPWLLAPELRFR
jgi:protease-4